jgi:hypothetical protein
MTEFWRYLRRTWALLPEAPNIAPGAGFWYFAGRERASEGSGMQIDPKECHPAMDYAEHQKTYKLFLKLSGYILIVVISLMALLAIFVV